MQILFSKTLPADDRVLPGQILIRPLWADAQRRNIAEFVLQRGFAGLARGTGPVTSIAISCDTTRPTFDDMLAAAFVQQIAAGRDLPAGCAAFARYAALVREGLQPGDVPLENSIEGIFLAIRKDAGDDLAQAACAEKFLAGWDEMALIILEAAVNRRDPFRENLFPDSMSFARQRIFLKLDHDVYQEDIRRGQRWLVKLPGNSTMGSATASGGMLLLDEPRSLLWKYWSRRDAAAPGGRGYVLLVIRRAAGQWTISTDPVRRLSLKELCSRLQEAENRIAYSPDERDPWFDGLPFAHSLIAAPRGGSRLSDRVVLENVRQWADAKPFVDARSNSLRGAAAVGAAILILAGLGFMINARLAPSAPVDFTVRGPPLGAMQIQDLKSDSVQVPGFAVIVGVGGAQGVFPGLPASCRNARMFYDLLRHHYGFEQANMRLLVDQPKDPGDSSDPDIAADGRPTRDGVIEAIKELSNRTARYEKGSRTNFVFFYGGHGDPRQVADNRIGYLVLDGYLPEMADTTGFDMSYLVSFISHRIASSHQMMLVDCCYSGFVVNARGLATANPSDVYALWGEKARAVITAGTTDQQSLEVGKKALFTSNLIRALSPTAQNAIPADANGDGIVTDAELFGYLSKAVSQDAHALGRNLTPQYMRALPDSDDDVGQFLFIPRQ